MTEWNKRGQEGKAAEGPPPVIRVLGCFRLRRLPSAIQGKVEAGVEFMQGDAANILFVKLQDGGQAGQLIQLDPAAAILPMADGYRANVERIGDLLLL